MRPTIGRAKTIPSGGVNFVETGRAVVDNLREFAKFDRKTIPFEISTLFCVRFFLESCPLR